MRIQFYPSQALQAALEEEAGKAGVLVSTLVNDLLERHYGLVQSNALSHSELRQAILQEVAQYVEAVPVGKEFDLNDASPTFRNIEMVCGDRPNIQKAAIGKEFNNKYVGKIEPFMTIKQVRLPNGNPKRSVGNRAALYKKTNTEETKA